MILPWNDGTFAEDEALQRRVRKMHPSSVRALQQFKHVAMERKSGGGIGGALVVEDITTSSAKAGAGGKKSVEMQNFSGLGGGASSSKTQWTRFLDFMMAIADNYYEEAGAGISALPAEVSDLILFSSVCYRKIHNEIRDTKHYHIFGENAGKQNRARVSFKKKLALGTQLVSLRKLLRVFAVSLVCSLMMQLLIPAAVLGFIAYLVFSLHFEYLLTEAKAWIALFLYDMLINNEQIGGAGGTNVSRIKGWKFVEQFSYFQYHCIWILPALYLLRKQLYKRVGLRSHRLGFPAMFLCGSSALAEKHGKRSLLPSMAAAMTAPCGGGGVGGLFSSSSSTAGGKIIVSNTASCATETTRTCFGRLYLSTAAIVSNFARKVLPKLNGSQDWYLDAWRFWVCVLCVVATTWTIAWDNYLVYRGVWGYEETDRVLFVIGWVPIEEYAFFSLETMLCGLIWALHFPNVDELKQPPVRIVDRDCEDGQATTSALAKMYSTPALFSKTSTPRGNSSPSLRRTGYFLMLFAFATGCALIQMAGGLQFSSTGKFSETEGSSGLYLGLILIWATPVLLIQWFYGAECLCRGDSLVWKKVVGISTVYLSLTDVWAIRQGVWRINPVFIAPLTVQPFGHWLPFEEAFFFLCTSIMCVWGLHLAMTVVCVWKMHSAVPPNTLEPTWSSPAKELDPSSIFTLGFERGPAPQQKMGEIGQPQGGTGLETTSASAAPAVDPDVFTFWDALYAVHVWEVKRKSETPTSTSPPKRIEIDSCTSGPGSGTSEQIRGATSSSPSTSSTSSGMLVGATLFSNGLALAVFGLHFFVFDLGQVSLVSQVWFLLLTVPLLGLPHGASDPILWYLLSRSTATSSRTYGKAVLVGGRRSFNVLLSSMKSYILRAMLFPVFGPRMLGRLFGIKDSAHLSDDEGEDSKVLASSSGKSTGSRTNRTTTSRSGATTAHPLIYHKFSTLSFFAWVAWYLGLMWATYLAWEYTSVLALQLFLVTSLYHFGEGDHQWWELLTSPPENTLPGASSSPASPSLKQQLKSVLTYFVRGGMILVTISRAPLDTLRVFVPLTSAAGTQEKKHEEQLFSLMLFLQLLYQIHFVATGVLLFWTVLLKKESKSEPDAVLDINRTTNTLMQSTGGWYPQFNRTTSSLMQSTGGPWYPQLRLSIRTLDVMEIVLLYALFHQLPPLIAFGIYFNFYHSLRHVVTMWLEWCDYESCSPSKASSSMHESRDHDHHIAAPSNSATCSSGTSSTSSNPSSMLRLFCGVTLVFTVLAILLIVLVVDTASSAHFIGMLARQVRLLFIGLSCVTTPHMIMVAARF
ncbi:unnamed protein product [Amoebophrya sp. A25]|nr:unnamed protein product [Amoebophrya sp. A25]|eukprot:GSA25T00008294001.1